MNNKPISILIPDGETNLALKVLRCLGQVRNLSVKILSSEKWNPIRLSRHHSGFFTHNLKEFNRKRLELILDLARQLKVDIILPVDQDTIRLTSEYREEVESVAALPPASTPAAIDIALDKWRLAELLKKEKIPFPDSILFQSEKPDEHDLTKMKYPVLTKPLEGAGGTGIAFFDNPSELSIYLKDKAPSKRLMIQSFIRGYDVDCSVLCKNGEIKAYTIQKGILPGRKRFEPPSSIEFVQHKQVYDNTEKLMRALNWSGVACMDLRYDEDKKEPKILEVNPRYWASVIGSMVAGINFPYLACQLSMSLDFPRPEYKLVRYTKPESALKLLIKQYLKGGTPVGSIKDTGLPYTLTDMGPEFIKYTAKFLERFSEN
jgi:predicted ATP-grasp superfamily ATP-dependent carboligase